MEEQFYALWPLALVLLRRWSPRAVFCWTTAAILLSLFARFSGPIGTHEGYAIAYYSPHTNVYALILGASAALARTRSVTTPLLSQRVSMACLTELFAVATVPGMKDGLRESDEASSLVLKLIAGPIAAVLALGLILAVVQGVVMPRWLTSTTMQYFDAISYGLYLWHEIIDWTIGRAIGSSGLPGLVSGSISAVIAVGIAASSHRYVETPFLIVKLQIDRRAVPNSTERADRGTPGGPIA